MLVHTRTRKPAPAMLDGIAQVPGARPAPLPASPPSPMQAGNADAPFADPAWLFEPKLDGVRAIATLNDGAVELRSRRQLDLTAQYPTLVAEVATLPAGTAILDGEIVALDEAGRPSFQALQGRLNVTRPAEVRRIDRLVPAYYFAFDLLYLDGFDLRRAPLRERKRLLTQVMPPSQHLQLVPHLEGDGPAMYAAALQNGFEGVVAKRQDSTYEAGKRSAAWVKVKPRPTEEFVVGGFTKGKRPKTFGALVLGEYDEQGRLHFVGHSGIGRLDERTLTDVRRRLDPLATDRSPFVERLPANPPTTFTRPALVAEFAYTERTRDGRLRSPTFLRLREDKAPEEVVRPYPKTPARLRTAAPTPARADGKEATDAQVAAVIEQLRAERGKTAVLEVGGHRLQVTHLDKVMWPPTSNQPAVTKRDLLVYLATVSPWLLPHVKDRPLTLAFYHQGVQGKVRYTHHFDSAPPFVETVQVYAESRERDDTWLLCNNLPTLLWLGHMNDVAVHVALTRVSPVSDAPDIPADFTGSREQVEASLLNHPEFLLFDLDPYVYAGTEPRGGEPALNPSGFAKACEVAMGLKELLDEAGLPSFVKTTGGTGLHVLVPVVRRLNFDAIKAVCGAFGQAFKSRHPGLLTTEWSVAKRAGRVFFDCGQNDRAKSIVAPYSPAAKPGATVSVPVTWGELPAVYPTDFTLATVPARLAKQSDPWAGILAARCDLQSLGLG